MAVLITGGYGHIGSTEELGYMPKYSIEEGVKRYADWLGKKCGNT